MSSYNRDRDYSPERKTYLQQYARDHYTQVGFYKVRTSHSYKSNSGTQIITPTDRLFKSKIYRWQYDCPARELVGLNIPRGDLIRSHYIKKKETP